MARTPILIVPISAGRSLRTVSGAHITTGTTIRTITVTAPAFVSSSAWGVRTSTGGNVPIERIEIFSLWVGFADPPAHAAKLVITRQGERFARERLPEQTTD